MNASVVKTSYLIAGISNEGNAFHPDYRRGFHSWALYS